MQGGTSDYELKTTLTLNQSGGTYVTYLRASTNALSGPAPVGTAYAFEVQNPTFSGSNCSATLAGYKIIGGAVTPLMSTTIPCKNQMTIRAIYTAVSNDIVIYVNNVKYYRVTDSSIASGQPGIGVRGAPSGNSISEVQLGGIYAGNPTMPPTNEIGVSAFSTFLEIHWPGASEPNGPGVAFYQIQRNGTYIENEDLTEAYYDPTVSPSTTYTYSIIAYDFDFNATTDTITVTTPPAGSTDPGEIGVHPKASIWGGGGEQIDMRSGNLNYTMPILKAMGRGGWGVGFNLTYNSQNWRQDPGGTWQLGADVGYGFGWELLAGSILPVIGPTGVIGLYIYTDATGARYILSQNNGGIWTSTGQGSYVSYDSNANKLHFNDGSFWVMGCTSAGTEWDSGTMYPTQMEDSNGNEVVITYDDGVGVTWNDSSSRINTIEDVRGNGSPDYTFTYNMDAIPHLTKIANSIGTSENYAFAYTENHSLTSPFGGQAYGTVTLLESAAANSIPSTPLTTYFTYDTASATTACSSSGTGSSGPGELTQVTTPYCGHLRWTYTQYTLSGSRTIREVQYRYLSMSTGAAETAIQLKRGNDSSYTVHSSAELDDTTANAEKYWTFQTAAEFNLGLQLTYQELTLSTGTALSLLDFTWAQTPTTLNPYIGTVVTKLSPGQTYEDDKQSTQTLDQYGNLLTVLAYNFGTGSVGSLARTYTNTYLNNSNYTPLYIFNRLLTSTVTDGTNTATLASNTYDTGTIANITGTLYEHDATYTTSFTYRGNVTASTTPTATTSNTYDLTGNVTSTTVNGVPSTITTTSATNYAAPTQITTNTIFSNMTWSSFLGLTSAADQNGDAASTTYDAYGRPLAVTSPYGAVTNYTYNDTLSPPNSVATTDGHWVETQMDGFGRPIHTITGYGTTSPTTVSTVDTKYAPCGCSPLGKMSQQSEPYGPTGTDAWTTYNYDASGRTTSVVLPDGSTTTYVYQGYAVTVTDPAGKYKDFVMDAFGNLTNVWEIDPLLGSVNTGYSHDILNHLTTVSMVRGSNSQTRTFNYTNSSHVVGAFLLSANNPENGTVTYTYSNNLLASKTDAKNQQLTYQYNDFLNRLTSVTWANASGGPQVLRTYYYDYNPLDSAFSQNALGRLAAVAYPSQGLGLIQMVDMYSYTAAGQPGAGLPAAKQLQVNQSTWYLNSADELVQGNGNASWNLWSGYTYNTEGKLTSVSYPATGSNFGPTYGPVYNYSYDSMYRLNGMTESLNGNNTTIVSNVSYNAANQLLTMNYPAANETRGYNVLGQLTSLSAGTTENLTYTYPTGTNNGKISSMYNAVSGETVSYQYDSLNRLFTAAGSVSGSTTWGDQYTFDPFGNLTTKQITAGSAPSLSVTVNPANNQIQGVSGLSYDANGNQNAGTYDAENRLILAGGLQYFYDGQNERIWSWGGTPDGFGNPTNYTVNLYSPGGQKLGAYLIAPFTEDGTGDLQVTLLSSDEYFGSRRLAVMDQLGSAGNNSSSAGTYYPFGEDKGSTDPQNTWSFATYWQDSTTGLDYANNRYYSNAYGRFTTPDPYQGNSGGPGDPNNPQSWNRYAYVTGDPVNFNDPQGLLEESDGPAVNPFSSSLCYPNYDPVWGGYYGCGSYPSYATFSVTVSADGSTGSTSYFNALRAARQAQSTESSLKDPSNGNCDTLLGMTWQGLQSAVKAENFKDGTESTATMVSLFAGSSAANQQNAIATYGNQTIQYYLAHDGINAAAVSSAGGNLVFLDYLNFGGALNVTNEAILMHEALHNATGLTDMQIQGLLNLAAGSSVNITNAVMNNCIY